ncbi:hypothetical protein M446_0574 [Methylobacterium sp. 4-46]|uniref:hypothetical protein n=1 Tax=unclassified Methylobacterium TaxID=2615210 RepID=UPI000152D9D6|nr:MULTISPECIES: hypothetical protein [Methylobacterium]ACA15136.1 hypothetical protein M446_0574 [Methylobacterium sp. 4-46]WFT80869.1 hypothetical protein QA634_02910 [Methylobacterium nodulans]
MRWRRVAGAAIIVGSTPLVPGSAGAQQLDIQNLVPCAQEGGVCRMPHPTNVYYGIPGKTVGRPFPQGGSIACTNQSFGDPVPGQRKMCWYAPRVGERGRGEGRARGGDEDPGYGRRGAPERWERGYDRRIPGEEMSPRFRRERESDDEYLGPPRDRGYGRYAPSPGGYGSREGRPYRPDPDDE